MTSWDKCVALANWIRLAGGRKLCLDCYEDYNRFDV